MKNAQHIAQKYTRWHAQAHMREHVHTRTYTHMLQGWVCVHFNVIYTCRVVVCVCFAFVFILPADQM